MWLLLSQLASASIKVNHDVVIKAWKDYSKKQGLRLEEIYHAGQGSIKISLFTVNTCIVVLDCDDETLCWVLSVIGSVSDKLSEDMVTSLTGL